MFAASVRASTSGALRATTRQRVPVARTLATLTEEQRLPSKFGGKYTVTLVPGDGIGPEVAESVQEVFSALKVPVEWEQYNVTGDNANDSLFQEAMESLTRNKVGLKGIIYTPLEKSGHNSWNVAMRQSLDIYASVVVCKTLPGLPTRHDNVDFAIIRENTEGEYSGLEHQSYPGVVESLKVTTRAKAERIARFAFDFAVKNNRKKVTCVHKANIMKLGDGLFLNTCKRIAEEEYGHTGIKFESMIVDNASMQLVSKPQQFDVVVLPNLYGNIISNIGAGLVGGPGVVPGCNFGREYALFEPGCRHIGKDIEGKNKANPTALLLSSTMLLRHLGLEEQANIIASSVYNVIAEGNHRTADVGGSTSTTDFTKAVLNKALA